MSLDSLCRWQVQVSVYCAWRIPAHLRCTQCSILLHLMDICFLTCICLWQISQIQTFLFKVVGPGLVSTSPAFVSNSASHPAGPHGRHLEPLLDSLPCLATVMSQINRCDDLFPSLLRFFFHCVYQLVSSHQCSFGKKGCLSTVSCMLHIDSVTLP